MHWHEQTDERDDTVTRALAEQLDLPVQEFIEVFGAGWQALPNAGHDFDALVGPWYIAGDPFQLMLRIRPDLEAVDVARPKGIWAGHSLVWRPAPRRKDHPSRITATRNGRPDRQCDPQAPAPILPVLPLLSTSHGAREPDRR